MKKILSILVASLGFIALSGSVVSASEGRTTLQNIAGGNSSCDAKSALMPDNKYTILITCKDLLYPPSNNTNAYVVWASPIDGDSALRLGALGFGRAQFRVNEPFGNLFVSQEKVNTQNLSSIRTPGTVVMRGNVDIDPAAPPVFEQPLDESEVVASPVPAQRSNLLGRIGTGVVVTIISIIVIIVMLVIVKPCK